MVLILLTRTNFGSTDSIPSREKTDGAKLKQLSAAEDGAVWGVNTEGQVCSLCSIVQTF